MTWRAQALVGGVLSGPVLTTTQTYTPTAGTAPANRLTAYPMGAWSEVKLPDTSQVVSTTTTFGEDSDYTTTPSANPQSFTDNGDGTITDNVTGLMWQKADAGEMTWENSVNNASAQTTGGYSDWRLPNPHELMSLFNYETGNPAMNATYFPPASPSAEYGWSRDGKAWRSQQPDPAEMARSSTNHCSIPHVVVAREFKGMKKAGAFVGHRPDVLRSDHQCCLQ
jgi:hypothetical protein